MDATPSSSSAPAPPPTPSNTPKPRAPVENRQFSLEASGGALTTLFGLRSIFFGDTALHRVVGVYLFFGGLFIFGLALRRRREPPAEPPSGVFRALEKLSEPKPFGFTLLAICLLPLAYGGIAGGSVFLIVYLSSVIAMRVTSEDLIAMVAKNYPTSPSRAKTPPR